MIAKIAAEPEMIERFKLQGVEIQKLDAGRVQGLYLNKEEKRWVTLIKEQGIKPE